MFKYQIIPHWKWLFIIPTVCFCCEEHKVQWEHLKVQSVVEETLMSWERSSINSDWRNNNTLHTALLCLYVADPATSLASDSVRDLFSSESSSLIHWWNTLCCYQQNFITLQISCDPEIIWHHFSYTSSIHRNHQHVQNLYKSACVRARVCAAPQIHAHRLVL